MVLGSPGRKGSPFSGLKQPVLWHMAATTLSLGGSPSRVHAQGTTCTLSVVLSWEPHTARDPQHKCGLDICE